MEKHVDRKLFGLPTSVAFIFSPEESQILRDACKEDLARLPEEKRPDLGTEGDRIKIELAWYAVGQIRSWRHFADALLALKYYPVYGVQAEVHRTVEPQATINTSDKVVG